MILDRRTCAMRSIYMDKSTESLCMESEYCIWNGVEDDLLIYPLQLVFWIYTLMLCILVYPSIFTSTSGDSCMLSETTYVSLVNFPPIQKFCCPSALSQTKDLWPGWHLSVLWMPSFWKKRTWLLNHWPWELRWFKVKSPKVILTHYYSFLAKTHMGFWSQETI